MLSEEVIARLSFDSSDFIKNTNKSIDQLDNLEKQLEFKKGEKNLDNLRKSFTITDMAIFSAVNSIVSTITNKLMRTINNITFKPIMSGIQEFETQINSIQVILANTMKDGIGEEQITKSLDILNVYADKTIYNFTQMTRAIGSFTSVGVDLDTSVAAIKGIANMGAFFGATVDQVQSSYTALSRAIKNDRLSGYEYRTLRMAGMAGERFEYVIKSVGNKLGKMFDRYDESGLKFQDAIEAGLVNSEVMLEALKIFSGEFDKDLFGSMEEYLLSLGYSENVAKDLASIAEQAEKNATNIRTYSQLMDTLAEQLQTGWADTWKLVIGGLEESTELFSGIEGIVGGWIQTVSNARNESLKVWREAKGAEKLANTILNIFRGIDNIFKKIGASWKKVFPKDSADTLILISDTMDSLATKFLNWTESTGAIEEVFGFIFGALSKLLPVAKALLKVFKQILYVIKGILETIIIIISKLLQKLDFSSNTILGWLDTLSDKLEIAGNKIAGYIEQIRDKFTKTEDIVEGAQAIDGAIKGIGTALEDSEEIAEKADFIASAIDRIAEAGANFENSNFVKFFKNIGTFIYNVFSFIGDTLFNFSEDLANAEFGTVNTIWEFILQNGKTILDFLLSLSIINVIDAFTDNIRSLTGTLDEMQKTITPSVILAIAASVLILAIAIGYMSQLSEDQEKVERAIDTIKYLLSGMTIAISAMGLMNIGFAGIFSAAILIAFTSAMAVLIIGVVAISKLSVGQAIQGVAVMIAMMGAITTMMYFLKKFGKDNKPLFNKTPKSLKIITSGLLSQAVMIMTLSVAMLAMTISLIAISFLWDSKDPGKLWFSVLALFSLMVMLTAAVILINKFTAKFTAEYKKTKLTHTIKASIPTLFMLGPIIMSLAIGLAVLVGAVVAITYLIDYNRLQTAMIVLGQMTLGLLAFIVVVSLLGRASAKVEFVENHLKSIKASIPLYFGMSIAMLGLAGSLALLVGSLYVLTTFIDMEIMREGIKRLGILAGGLVLLIAGLTLISKIVVKVKDEEGKMKFKAKIPFFFGMTIQIYSIILGIYMLIPAIYILGKLAVDNFFVMYKGSKLLTDLAVVLVGIVLSLKFLTTKMAEFSYNKDGNKEFNVGIQGILNTSGMIVAVALGFLIMVYALSFFMNNPNISTLKDNGDKLVNIIIALGVVLMVIVFTLQFLVEKVEISKETIGDEKSITATYTNMLSISAAILAIGFSFSLLIASIGFMMNQIQDSDGLDIIKKSVPLLGTMFLAFLSLIAITKSIQKFSVEFNKRGKDLDVKISGSTMTSMIRSIMAISFMFLAFSGSFYLMLLAINSMTNAIENPDGAELPAEVVPEGVPEDSSSEGPAEPEAVEEQVDNAGKKIKTVIGAIAGIVAIMIITVTILTLLNKKLDSIKNEQKVIFQLVGPIAATILAFGVLMLMINVFINSIIEAPDPNSVSWAVVIMAAFMGIIILVMAATVHFLLKLNKESEKTDKASKKTKLKSFAKFTIIFGFVVGFVSMLIKMGLLLSPAITEGGFTVIAFFVTALAVIGGIYLLTKTLSTIDFDKTNKNIVPFIKMMGVLFVAILVLSQLLKLVQKFDFGGSIETFKQIIITLLLVRGMFSSNSGSGIVSKIGSSLGISAGDTGSEKPDAKSAKNAILATLLAMSVVAALYMLVVLLSKFSSSDFKGAMINIGFVIVLIVAVSALAAGLTYLGESDHIGPSSIAKSTASIALTTVIITALYAFVIIANKFSSINLGGTIISIGLVIVLVAVIALLAAGLSLLGDKFLKPKSIGKALISIFLLTAVILVIYILFGLLNKIFEFDMKKTLINMLVMILIITVLALVVGLISKIGGGMKGAASLLIISVGLVAMAIAFKMMGKLAWGEIGRIAALLGIFLVFLIGLALIGYVAGPAIIVIAIAVGILGVAILALGLGIYFLAAGIEKFSTISGPAMTQAMDNILLALKKSGSIAVELANLLTTFIVNALWNVHTRMNDILTPVALIVDDILDWLQEEDRLQGWITSLVEILVSIIIGVFNGLTNKMPEFAKSISGFLNAIEEHMIPLVEQMGNTLGQVLAALLLSPANILEGGVDYVGGKAKGWWNKYFGDGEGLEHSVTHDNLYHAEGDFPDSTANSQVEFTFGKSALMHNNRNIETEILNQLGNINLSKMSGANDLNRIANNATIYIYNGTVINYNSDVNITFNNTFESVDNDGMSVEEMSHQMGVLLEKEMTKWR